MNYAIAKRDANTPNGRDTYIHEIQEDRVLTAEEECELAFAIKRGDQAARDRMIRMNLRLVVKIAHDFEHRGLSLEDLVQEGNLGLIRAVRDFDPTRGTRFSTYASNWIKQAIRHALINTTPLVRIPSHMVGLLNKWRRAERKLAKELGRAASDVEIARELGITDAQMSLVEYARRARQVRLESASSEEGGWTVESSPDRHDSPEVEVDRADERRFILKRLDRLEQRDRMIIIFRYGLGGREEMKLREIGEKLGVTREWIRKIEHRTLQQLRDGDWSADHPDSSGAQTPGPVDEPATPARSSRRNRSVNHTRRQEKWSETSRNTQTSPVGKSRSRTSQAVA
jgi:RNA polymerase primary sigma factor